VAQAKTFAPDVTNTTDTSKPALGTVVLNGDIVVLRGEVNGSTVSKAIAGILSAPGNNVTLFLDTPGGSVFDGMQLVDVIKATNKKITCVASTAASMGFVVLQACDERIIMHSGVIMQHLMAGGTRGNLPNMVKFVDLLVSISERTEREQAARIGISVEQFKKNVANDWWLLGEDAVKAGAADRVAPVTCTPDAIAKKVDEKIQTLFGTISVTWSGCPLLGFPLDVKGELTKEQYNQTFNFREVLMQGKK
jgi:ATP-dependent protease ClpP protease subunit